MPGQDVFSPPSVTLAENLCPRCHALIPERECLECGYSSTKDARLLVAIALAQAPEELYEIDWSSGRTEAAMRRVIRYLENVVGQTVQQELGQ